MAVPEAREFYLPTLEIAKEAPPGGYKHNQFMERLITKMGLTEADLQEALSSGRMARVDNRARWARTHLKVAGLMDNPQTGYWEITPQGRNFLRTYSNSTETITYKMVRAFTSTSDTSDTSEALEVSDASSDERTPDELIERGYSLHRKRLEDEILERIKNMPDKSFERLTTNFLKAVGYGEIEQETGRPGDQGIDGIINQDTLGLDKVYVQAKRYRDTTIGEPEIRNFSGSLGAKGATKGVFITTSTFSKVARQTARDISFGNQLIRLIDGKELAGLMIDYDVGVITETTHKIKKPDANFFEEP